MKYESEHDRDAEKEIAMACAKEWKGSIVRSWEYAHFDFFMTRNGQAVGMIECRDRPSMTGAYSSIVIDVDKVQGIREYQRLFPLRCVFAVRDAMKVIWWHKLETLDPSAYKVQSGFERNNDKAWRMAKDVYHIPFKLFTKLGDAVSC